MTERTKQCGMRRLAAALALVAAAAGWCSAGMEDSKTGAARFDAGMDIKELMKAQTVEMEAMPSPQPEPVKAGGLYGPGKDAFAGLDECRVVNAVFVRQPSLADAVKMFEPCAKAVAGRYGIAVSVGELLMRDRRPSPPSRTPDVYVTGIGVFVSGVIPAGNAVLADLYYTVDVLRRGSLLGHPARVEYHGVISHRFKPSDIDLGAVRQAIKDTLETGFSVGSYKVVTGVQLEPVRPGEAAVRFKAHMKVVGRGWDERYAVTGTYDTVTDKADYQTEKLWGNAPRWPITKG